MTTHGEQVTLASCPPSAKRPQKTMQSFNVNSKIVTLSVTTDGSAVGRIELHGRKTGPARTDFEKNVEQELNEYLEGERREFSFPIRAEGTDFQKKVWGELKKIPYGQTASYGEIAKRLGKPGASRAVGMANHRNPLPIVIPCHRVVAAGGKLGGFGGGVDLKKRLLDLETVTTIGEA